MKFHNALLPLTLAALTACGGGGGGTATPQLPPQTGVPITSDNAGTATKIAWEATNASAGMTDLLGNSGFVATAPGGTNKPQQGIESTASLINVLQKIPFGPDFIPCQVDGSITISGDLANPLTLTAGDSIVVDADVCDDGLGEVIDGVLSFTVNEFGGDLFAGAYQLTMSMNLNNFQIVSAIDTITSSGDAQVSLNTLAAPAVSASVSGSSLTTNTNTASATMSSYSSAQTVDAGQQPAPYTLTSQAALDSSEMAGPINYSTPVTFEGFDSDNPHTGELLVVGENSSARLIVVDNINVRIEIDSNGDGTVDETIDTTWAELTS